MWGLTSPLGHDTSPGEAWRWVGHFACFRAQMELEGLGRYQTWLGPIAAAHLTRPWELAAALHPAFRPQWEQPVCWGAKWPLCSVGNQNLERDELKSFVSACMDLPHVLAQVSLYWCFTFWKWCLNNHISYVNLAITFSSSGMIFASYAVIEQVSKIIY